MRGRRQRPKERSKRLADLSIPKEEALEPEIREVKKEKPEASIEAYLARIDLKRNPEIKKFDQGEFFLRLGKLNWNELNISEKIIALNESGFSGNTIKRILLEEGKNEGSLYSSLAMVGYSKSESIKPTSCITFISSETFCSNFFSFWSKITFANLIISLLGRII